ncbi:alginate export family protein [Salinisphaera sp. LB1]|uniref:alginate export family protein n=1 Tax=Salinisphaera sp. LB1 TaxID=2183911 RepID=UPI000D7D51BD|nr:alginate export family protein [Salinisphaera sp. LB1]AWN16735.1 Glutamate synthase [NADPH] large chain [Salinisphaera sp. LB1]
MWVAVARGLVWAAAVLVCTPGIAAAHTLYQSKRGRKLDFILDAGVGLFSSQYDYSGQRRGCVAWSLSAAIVGLSGELPVAGGSTVYGAVSGLGTVVNGDGDAAGFSHGGDRSARIDQAYVGWRSGTLLGVKNAIDVSVGKQGVTLGRGWLVDSGALAVGTGRTFDETAIARFRLGAGFTAKAFYLGSDKAMTGKTHLAGADLAYADGAGDALGATYLRVTDVDSTAFHGLWVARAGLNTFSVRGRSRLGLDHALFSFAGTLQRGRPTVRGRPRRVKAWAWYAQAAYRFSGWLWTPKLVYRFSSFSGDNPDTRTLEGYDPLFYGFYRQYGTWNQGDVAGVYTGPFNRNADIQHVGLYVHPPGLRRAGVMFFHYRIRQTPAGVSDDFAREWDFFVDWWPKPNLLISPSFVIFDPGAGATALIGARQTNHFFQLIAVWQF